MKSTSEFDFFLYFYLVFFKSIKFAATNSLAEIVATIYATVAAAAAATAASVAVNYAKSIKFAANLI